MKEENKEEFFGKKARTLALKGAVVGLFSGISVIIYKLLIDKSTDFITNFYKEAGGGEILALCLIFALFSLWAVRLMDRAPLSGGSGIPQIMGEIRGKFSMNPIRVTLSKFLGGFFSAIGGLSMGREGPSVQIGGACGKIFGSLSKDDQEKKNLISAGAGAGLAGAFCAPLSGILIVLEEFNKSISPLLLIPLASACLVASLVYKLVFGPALMFSFSIKSQLPLKFFGHLLPLGIFLGLVGVAFNEGLQGLQGKFKKSKIRREGFIYSAFLLAIVFGKFFPYVLGGGHSLVEEIFYDDKSLGLLAGILILKLAYTAYCFATGIQGGSLVPSLAIGAVAGGVYFKLVNRLGLVSMPDTYFVNFLVMGMAGMLAAVMRSPFTALAIVVEMTGSYKHFLDFILVILLASLTADLLKSKPFYSSLLERMEAEKKPVEEKKFLQDYLTFIPA